MTHNRIAGLIVLAVLAASCKASPSPAPTAAPTTAPTPAQSQASGYPGMTPTPVNGYPALTANTPDPSAIAMEMDRPVKAGATTVTGRGPAGVVIAIENVTTMGTELGSGVVGPDNRFSVSVAPLEAGIRLGLSVTDVGSSGKRPDDFNSDAYKGKGALMVPQVGYFQDTVSVEP